MDNLLRISSDRQSVNRAIIIMRAKIKEKLWSTRILVSQVMLNMEANSLFKTVHKDCKM